MATATPDTAPNAGGVRPAGVARPGAEGTLIRGQVVKLPPELLTRLVEGQRPLVVSGTVVDRHPDGTAQVRTQYGQVHFKTSGEALPRAVQIQIPVPPTGTTTANLSVRPLAAYAASAEAATVPEPRPAGTTPSGPAAPGSTVTAKPLAPGGVSTTMQPATTPAPATAPTAAAPQAPALPAGGTPSGLGPASAGPGTGGAAAAPLAPATQTAILTGFNGPTGAASLQTSQPPSATVPHPSAATAAAPTVTASQGAAPPGTAPGSALAPVAGGVGGGVPGGLPSGTAGAALGAGSGSGAAAQAPASPADAAATGARTSGTSGPIPFGLGGTPAAGTAAGTAAGSGPLADTRPALAGMSARLTSTSSGQPSARAAAPEQGLTQLLQATASPNPTAASGRPAPLPSLSEALAALASANPTLANAVTQAMVPQPNGQLTAAVLFFLTAVRGGDFRSWLGERASRTLESAGRGDLLARLGGEAAAFSRQAAETVQGDWRSYTIPMLSDEGLGSFRLLVRPRSGGEDGRTGDDGDPGSRRFLIDVEMSRLGPLQIDGLFKTRKLDLVVRSHTAFSLDDRREMTRIFAQACETSGISGALSFHTDGRSWVKIAESRSKTVAPVSA